MSTIEIRCRLHALIEQHGDSVRECQEYKSLSREHGAAIVGSQLRVAQIERRNALPTGADLACGPACKKTVTRPDLVLIRG